MEARRAAVVLTYNGTDISADVSGSLESFTFTDSAGDQADDLQLVLEDVRHLWRGPWFPAKGARLVASIVPTEGGVLRCGTFEIDEVTVAGPPSTVTIKAASTGISTALRRERHSRAWEGVSLRDIAATIAAEGGVGLFYDAAASVRFDRVDQRQESQLAFLRRLCSEAGLSIKVSDNQIVIYDAATYEARPPVATIRPDDPRVIAWSLATKAHDVYRACRVRYHNAAEGIDIEHTFTPGNAPAVGHVLEIEKRVESLGAAEALAVRELRRRNKVEVTATVSCVGNTNLSAGQNVTLSGFGALDSVFHIEQARHVYGSGGYLTELELRRVLGY